MMFDWKNIVCGIGGGIIVLAIARYFGVLLSYDCMKIC